VWQALPWIRARRRKLAGMRARRDADIVGRFSPVVDSPQISSDVARKVAPLLRLYHRLAVALVRAIGR
jgi:hypothetical protein